MNLSTHTHHLYFRDALFWRAVLAEGCATAAFTFFLLSVRPRGGGDGLLCVVQALRGKGMSLSCYLF